MLLTEEEKANVPASFETVPAKGLGKDAPAYFYRMQVSPYDLSLIHIWNAYCKSS